MKNLFKLALVLAACGMGTAMVASCTASGEVSVNPSPSPVASTTP